MEDSVIKLIDIENLSIYDEKIKDYIKSKAKESSEEIIVSKDSFLNFPVTGNSDCLYIDTTTNKAYRWSEDETKYYCIGSDWTGIQLINCDFD